MAGHRLKVPAAQEGRGQLMYTASSKAMLFLPRVVTGLQLKTER